MAISVCRYCKIISFFAYYIQAEIASALNPIGNFAPCIFGPRLLLNLREAYYLPFEDECSVFSERNIGFIEENVNEDASING